ncbi:MAG: hypothetical protein MHM6MM_002214 [Cercozoa sp. M6MM]
MTWIKTNFLWMCYRSGWNSKPNQERTLAIWLKRSAFLEILNDAVISRFPHEAAAAGKFKFTDETEFRDWCQERKNDTTRSFVRLQWDPDHLPNGHKTQRRAIQLGIKRRPSFANGEDILRIEDITDSLVIPQQTAALHPQIAAAGSDGADCDFNDPEVLSAAWPDLVTPMEDILRIEDPNIRSLLALDELASS